MLPILPNVLVNFLDNFVLKYFSRVRRRANDGVRPVGVSELPWRLPAQQGVHLEDHGASRVPSRTQVPIVWGITYNSKVQNNCIVRESNPGRPRGRRAFYHWTNDALILLGVGHSTQISSFGGIQFHLAWMLNQIDSLTKITILEKFD